MTNHSTFKGTFDGSVQSMTFLTLREEADFFLLFDISQSTCLLLCGHAPPLRSREPPFLLIPRMPFLASIWELLSVSFIPRGSPRLRLLHC